MAGPFSGVDASAAQTAALIDARFRDAHERSLDRGELGIVREFVDEIGGDVEGRKMRSHTIAAPRHAPHVQPWAEDEDRPLGGFEYDATRFRAFRYSNGVRWRESDEIYDQTGALVAEAEHAAESWQLNSARLFFAAITGTNTDLMQETPTALDGVGVFSATDGRGAARFGATGGNIFTASGTTAAAYRTDILGVINRAAQMRDYAARTPQPLLDPGAIMERVVIIAAVGQREVLTEAVVQPLVANAAGTAAPANVLHSVPAQFVLHFTSRLTGTGIFVGFPKAQKRRPFVKLDDTGIIKYVRRDGSTSDEVFNKGWFSVAWHQYFKYGLVRPANIFRIGTLTAA